MKILLCVGVFVLLTAISPTFLSGARAIVQGPTATEFQVTINPTSTVTGQVYSSPQNPCCGAFWSVTAWIGRNGGPRIQHNQQRPHIHTCLQRKGHFKPHLTWYQAIKH